jgi:hypothetical protein
MTSVTTAEADGVDVDTLDVGFDPDELDLGDDLDCEGASSEPEPPVGYPDHPLDERGRVRDASHGGRPTLYTLPRVLAILAAKRQERREGPESGVRLTAIHEVDRMTFKDHFSGHAPDYSSFRRTYPRALYEQLASLASAHDLAWDCATGNG